MSVKKSGAKRAASEPATQSVSKRGGTETCVREKSSAAAGRYSFFFAAVAAAAVPQEQQTQPPSTTPELRWHTTHLFRRYLVSSNTRLAADRSAVRPLGTTKTGKTETSTRLDIRFQLNRYISKYNSETTLPKRMREDALTFHLPTLGRFRFQEFNTTNLKDPWDIACTVSCRRTGRLVDSKLIDNRFKPLDDDDGGGGGAGDYHEKEER